MQLAKHPFCFGDTASFLFLQLMDFQICFVNLAGVCMKWVLLQWEDHQWLG